MELCTTFQASNLERAGRVAAKAQQIGSLISTLLYAKMVHISCIYLWYNERRTTRKDRRAGSQNPNPFQEWYVPTYGRISLNFS